MKKIVIIGYGNMGQRYARMIYEGKIRDLSLRAILCRRLEVKKEIEERLPGVEVLLKEEQLAELTDYDGVIISTPHKEHVRVAEQVLLLGKHVLCEKPLSIAAGDCFRLRKLAENSNIVFAVMFNWRQRKVYQKVHEYLAEGQLGKLHSAFWIANFWFRPQKYHNLSAWRSSWSGEGGGLTINQCQHLLDIWNWFFGQPDEIYADIRCGRFSNIEVDDQVNLTMNYSNGMTGTLFTSSGDYPGSNHLEIHGELGKLVVEDNARITIYKNEKTTDYVVRNATEINPTIPYTVECMEIVQEREEYEAMLEDFSDAICGNRNPTAGLKEGIEALEVANAAYLSYWKQQKVIIPCDEKEYLDMLRQHLERHL